MTTIHKKFIALFYFLFLFTLALKAQDVIIKNNKSEIKSKVIEITETSVKYKNWDNQDGPIYNIARSGVFMIVYANGQREILKDENKATSAKAASATSGGTEANDLSSMPQKKTANNVDTAINYKGIKVKYKPTRFLYWFQSPPTSIGIQQEFRVIKNMLNIGGGTDYFFVTGASEVLYSFYAEPYLAVNRLCGNYKNQDKGLFINGKIGYSSLSVTYHGASTNTGGLMVGIGADFLITRSIGLSISGFKFAQSDFSFQGGICINIL